MGLHHFPATDLPQVLKELAEPATSGTYLKRHKVPWVEWESNVEMPINLDGEPIKAHKIRFEVLPGKLKLVPPPNCPMTG